MLKSICPQCGQRNPWERLYCGHCDACLKGADLVREVEKVLPAERLLAGARWLVLLLVLVLSLSGMAALLGRFLL